MPKKEIAITWVKEPEASQMLGYSCETLRKYVKSGRVPVAYTHFKKRNYQYSQADLENFLLANSTVTR